MSFPPGPFFNFRMPDEINWFHKLIIVLFGEKKIAEDSGYRVTAYYFRGITYISDLKVIQ